MEAFTSSRGAVSAVSRRADPRRLPLPGRQRGRVLRAGQRRLGRRPADARRRRRRARRLRAHRPRAQGPADRALPGRRGGALRAGHRGGRDEPSWREEARGLVRVPASSANLGPGFDVMGAALDLHMEVDVVETGRFAVHTDLRIAARPPQPDRARVRRAAPARRLRVHDPLRHPALRRARAPARRRSSPAWSPRTRSSSSGADLLAEATRLEGHPDNVAAALLGGFVLCCGRARGALRPARRPRVPARRARDARAHRQGARGAPVADPGPRRRLQHRPRLAARARPRPRRPRPRRPRPRRPHPPAAPRAPLPALVGARRRARRTSARWARRSPAPGRPCSSGATSRSTGAVAARLDQLARRLGGGPARAVHAHGADVRSL